jgi:ribonuclease I
MPAPSNMKHMFNNNEKTKYLTLTNVDEEFYTEDEKVHTRVEKQNKWVTTSLWILICLSFSFSIYVVLIEESNSNSENDSSPNQCYIGPSCTATLSNPYNTITGFTNNTGWDLISEDECCQICDLSNSNNLKFESNDIYDYLLLDLLWLPQFCNGLNQGHDFTLSHLDGTLCSSNWVNSHSSISTTNLTIHGVWPSRYDNDFVSCCPNDDNKVMSPLIPDEVSNWHIYNAMLAEWPDVTVEGDSSTTCPICYLNNHEWLKHGTCYSKQPEDYFTTGLTLADYLSTNTTFISSAYSNNIKIKRSNIASIFPFYVNVMCDPQDNTLTDEEKNTIGVFSELQTCFIIPNGGLTEFQMIDCPSATGNKFTTPCPEFIIIR